MWNSYFQVEERRGSIDIIDCKPHATTSQRLYFIHPNCGFGERFSQKISIFTFVIKLFFSIFVSLLSVFFCSLFARWTWTLLSERKRKHQIPAEMYRGRRRWWGMYVWCAQTADQNKNTHERVEQKCMQMSWRWHAMERNVTALNFHNFKLFFIYLFISHA